MWSDFVLVNSFDDIKEIIKLIAVVKIYFLKELSSSYNG